MNVEVWENKVRQAISEREPYRPCIHHLMMKLIPHHMHAKNLDWAIMVMMREQRGQVDQSPVFSSRRKTTDAGHCSDLDS